MWLKLLTTLSLILGIGLIVLTPWLYHRQPHPPLPGFPVNERLNFEFHAMVLGYTGMILFSFVGAASLAMLLIRIARDDYRTALSKNVQQLVSSYPDAPKKQDPS